MLCDMKAIVLAAGKNESQHWPILIDKLKCLYSYKGLSLYLFWSDEHD